MEQWKKKTAGNTCQRFFRIIEGLSDNRLHFVSAQNARHADAKGKQQQRSGNDRAWFWNGEICGRRFGVSVTGDAGDVRSLVANIAEIKTISFIPALADIPNVTIIFGILNNDIGRAAELSALAVIFNGKTSPV
jgi:hypothetical protein